MTATIFSSSQGILEDAVEAWGKSVDAGTAAQPPAWGPCTPALTTTPQPRRPQARR
jgi:hypothetical protein